MIEEFYYVGSRVIDQPKNPIPSVIRKCSECGADIWISKKTLKKAEKCVLLCGPCFENLDGIEITVCMLPETVEELIDLYHNDSFYRRKH